MNCMNHAVFIRLRFIDFLLGQYGTVNRSAVMDYFGISAPQASADIQAYISNAPDNMEYDTSGKRYRRTESFKRRFP